MQFLTLELGGPDTAFPESGNSVTMPFTFPRPANAVFALLQAFDLEFDASDNELDSIRILPIVHFGAGDQSGTVVVRFAMVGDEISWPWNFPSNLITAHIRLLVVGSDTVPNSPIIL
jgi:hypothetical protein